MYTTKLDKIIDWFDDLFSRYNCEKNRHRWGYLLSETGKVYLDDSKIPKDKWICLDCNIKRY